MIIPKEYGGLQLNHHEQSQVVQKISTASSPVGVTVMVPNSLGPARIIIKIWYSTKKKKQLFTKNLLLVNFIPCFGLTGQSSGSDAASMLDSGVLNEENGIKYINLNISKRYITLAPISNLIGVAFSIK